MPDSPQDIYVRHLLSHRGYPLWMPEPSRRLPQDYLREGLRIGDVGVVVPENGSFDVFFNICLPPEHPLHRRGVPDNFNPISLDSEDIDVFPSAEHPGRVIASPSVRQVDPPGESHARAEYDFYLPPSEGALLVLPQGAEHHDLRIRRIFLHEALQYAADWYDFAERHLHRIISRDSLYLITGFYKARSWSLASFPNVTGTNEFPVRLTVAQSLGGNPGSNYTWRHQRALDWRVGPPDELSNGIPNQAVFTSGFKIAVSDELLVWKRITVKADTDPQQPEASNVVGRGSWLPNLWSNLARMGGTSEAGSQYNMPSGSGTRASLAHSSGWLVISSASGCMEVALVNRCFILRISSTNGYSVRFEYALQLWMQ
ncbi:hypothetical protein J3R83DRAFT_11889 [Lanmaoa asiatica]|nr:hypothetical protein J3R83DRAFT_11889 [Lanmaoa asiatica]